MLRQFSTRRIVGFVIIDFISTWLLFFLANQIRIVLGLLPGWLSNDLRMIGVPLGSQVSNSALIQPYFLVLILLPITMITTGVYDGRKSSSLMMELRHIFVSVSLAVMLLSGALFFSFRETSRITILLFYIFELLGLCSSRLLLVLYNRIFQHEPSSSWRKVLIIGAGQVGAQIAHQLGQYANYEHLELVGYLDDDSTKHASKVAGLRVIGSIDDLESIISNYHIQDVVIALPLRAHERMVNVCRKLQKLSVRAHVIPDLIALSFPNSTLDGFGGIPVVTLGTAGLNGGRRLAKRIFDTVIVCLLLLLIWPVLLIIAILIKLESPGPAIYKTERIGEFGKPFTMFKFRSMHAGASASGHQEYVQRLITENLSPEDVAHLTGQNSLKVKNDDRITRIGKFIRKTSLDEVPQIFNVLRGEMSLVGPRPPLPYEFEVYNEWHKERLNTIPGMTGIWQVKAHNKVSFDEMVRMDIEYIQKQNIWMDFLIILQTPFSLLTDIGSG